MNSILLSISTYSFATFLILSIFAFLSADNLFVVSSLLILGIVIHRRVIGVLIGFWTTVFVTTGTTDIFSST